MSQASWVGGLLLLLLLLLFNGLRPAADLFPFLVRACAYAFVCEVLDVAREKIL